MTSLPFWYNKCIRIGVLNKKQNITIIKVVYEVDPIISMEQKFSVLMSVYKGDNPVWLKEALESVFAQTVKPNEVVIVCDGPLTKELEDVLAQYSSKIILHRLVKNSGLGEALRQGIEKCSYPLIARMDSDDISLPDRFEKQLLYFEKYPDIAVLSGWIQEIDGDSLQPIAIRKVPCTDLDIKKFIRTRSPFNHMTVMYKKSAILDVGNYQPFHLMEDYYLWARMSAKGYEMANLPAILLNARINSAMYGRRGGLKYFKSNYAMSKKLCELGLISLPTHLFNMAVRFCVQVLMPNSVRGYFYRKALR